MNGEKLMKIIGEANEEYIQSAMETRGRKKTRHRGLSFVSKVAIAAAIIMSMAVTAYATDGILIKSLTSGGGKQYSSFEKMDKAMKEAGFEIEMKERFDCGYAFEKMDVSTVQGQDEDRNQVMSFKDISINLKNDQGHIIYFGAHEDLEVLKEMPEKDDPIQESRQIGDITVAYRVINTKCFPAEKEGNLTEEEKAWQEQPGNYISYFSWEGEAFEEKTAFLSWTKDGICYGFMDQDADESPDVLFAMAEELINQ